MCELLGCGRMFVPLMHLWIDGSVYGQCEINELDGAWAGHVAGVDDGDDACLARRGLVDGSASLSASGGGLQRVIALPQPQPAKVSPKQHHDHRQRENAAKDAAEDHARHLLILRAAPRKERMGVRVRIVDESWGGGRNAEAS